MTGPGPAGLLALEFTPEWEITTHPAGLSVVTAWKCSDDGRHRRYLVARTAAELLARLRAIRDQEAGSTCPERSASGIPVPQTGKAGSC